MVNTSRCADEPVATVGLAGHDTNGGESCARRGGGGGGGKYGRTGVRLLLLQLLLWSGRLVVEALDIMEHREHAKHLSIVRVSSTSWVAWK